MASINATSATKLEIKHNGVDYVLEASGLKRIAGKAPDAKEAKEVMLQVLSAAEGEERVVGDLRKFLADPKVKKTVEESLDKAVDYTRLNKLHEGAKGAEAIAVEAAKLTKAADPAAAKKIRQILITSGEGMEEASVIRKMLDDTSKQVMAGKNFSQQELIDVKTAYSELSTLLKESQPDAKAIKKVLINNHVHAGEAIDAIRSIDSKIPEFDALRLAESRINLNKALGEAQGAIGTSKDVLKKATLGYKQELENLEKANVFPKNASKIRTAEEAITQHQKVFLEELQKDTGAPAVESLKKQEGKKFFEHIMENNSTIKTELEALAKDGAKSASTAISSASKALENGAKWWQSESKLASVVKAGEKPGLFNSGKTGVIIGGIALVGTAAYAAFGNRGSAAKENERRVNEAMLQQNPDQGQVAAR